MTKYLVKRSIQSSRLLKKYQIYQIMRYVRVSKKYAKYKNVPDF
jgi:hypothetical protein